MLEALGFEFFFWDLSLFFFLEFRVLVMRIGLVLLVLKGVVASRFTLPCPNVGSHSLDYFLEHERVPRVFTNLVQLHEFRMCRHGGANKWLFWITLAISLRQRDIRFGSNRTFFNHHELVQTQPVRVTSGLI